MRYLARPSHHSRSPAVQQQSCTPNKPPNPVSCPRFGFHRIPSLSDRLLTCNLTDLSPILTTFELNSTPIVCGELSLTASSRHISLSADTFPRRSSLFFYLRGRKYSH